MQPLVEQMTANIDRTTALYEEILAVERRKQRAIVESNVETLSEIVAREEQLCAQAAELEASRLALRDALASRDERLGPAPRLREVIELLDGPERQTLSQKHHHLRGLAEQINDVNRTNFQLLRSSLDLLRGLIDDVFGAASAPNTYDPSGRHEAAPHDPTRVNQVL